MKNRKRLGELMTESGLVSQDQLNEALADQWQFGGRLGSILIDKCAIDEKTFLRVLSEQLKVQTFTLRGRTIKEEVMRLIPKETAWKYLAVPVETKVVNNRPTLVVAMADPTDAFAVAILEKISGHRIEPALAYDNTIRMVLMEFYDNQYGRGDITLRRSSEPDECELRRIAVATHERKPLDVSAIWGRAEEAHDRGVEEAEMVEEMGIFAGATPEPETPDAETVHDRLSLELQAMLQLLVKKGMIKPEEYAEELKGLRLQN